MYKFPNVDHAIDFLITESYKEGGKAIQDTAEDVFDAVLHLAVTKYTRNKNRQAYPIPDMITSRKFNLSRMLQQRQHFRREEVNSGEILPHVDISAWTTLRYFKTHEQGLTHPLDARQRRAMFAKLKQNGFYFEGRHGDGNNRIYPKRAMIEKALQDSELDVRGTFAKNFKNRYQPRVAEVIIGN